MNIIPQDIYEYLKDKFLINENKEYCNGIYVNIISIMNNGYNDSKQFIIYSKIIDNIISSINLDNLIDNKEEHHTHIVDFSQDIYLAMCPLIRELGFASRSMNNMERLNELRDNFIFLDSIVHYNNNTYDISNLTLDQSVEIIKETEKYQQGEYYWTNLASDKISRIIKQTTNAYQHICDNSGCKSIQLNIITNPVDKQEFEYIDSLVNQFNMKINHTNIVLGDDIPRLIEI